MSSTMIVGMSDRPALIEHFKPTDEIACQAFGMTAEELELARGLQAAGLVPTATNVDFTKYANVFSVNKDAPKATITTANSAVRPHRTGSASTTHVRPESASRPARTPLKRGRKGNKIALALQAITTTPQDFDKFLEAHGVSAAVMKQSKRFIAELDAETARKIGVVHVRKDKNTKTQMIWREDV